MNSTEQAAPCGSPLTEGLGPARYLLCTGRVMSKTDGQYHYVGAHDLARLYGVRMDQCEVRPERMIARFGWRPTAGVTELHPRYDGNYSLPPGPNVRGKRGPTA